MKGIKKETKSLKKTETDIQLLKIYKLLMQTSQREMTEAPSEAESKLTTKKQDCISHYLLLIIVVITKGEKN